MRVEVEKMKRMLVPVLVVSLFILLCVPITIIEMEPKTTVNQTKWISEHPWPNVYGDAQLTNRVDQDYSEMHGHRLWQTSNLVGFTQTKQSPIVSLEGDIIYTNGDTLFCVSENGTTRWSEEINSNEDLSSPALGPDGDIYVCCEDGKLYCYDKNGSYNWYVEVRDKSISHNADPVVFDNMIFYSVYGGNLISLWPNGTVRFKNTSVNKFCTSTAFAQNGTFYIGTHDGEVYCYSINGTNLWRSILKVDVINSLALFNESYLYAIGRIYNGTRLYSLFPNGTERWNYTIHEPDASSYKRKISIDHNGNVYANCQDGYLYYINKNGELVWKSEFPDFIGASVSVSTDGTILLPRKDKVYILNKNGSKRDEISLQCNCKSLAFDAEGRFYSYDNGLAAVEMVYNVPPVNNNRFNDIVLQEDESISFYLSDHFRDYEDDNWELMYGYECDNQNVNIDIEDYYVTIYGDENYHGTAPVRFYADDSGKDGIFGNGDDERCYGNWFNINITSVLDPPQILNRTIPDAIEGELYQVEFTAVDPDSDVNYLTWELDTYFDWLYMRGNVLEGIPGVEDVYTETVLIEVTDQDGAYGSLEFNVTVINKEDPPQVFYKELIEADEDDEVTVNIDYIEYSETPSFQYDDIIILEPDGQEVTVEVDGGEFIDIEEIEYRGVLNKLKLTFKEDWYGKTNLTLKVSDGTYETIKKIPVRVLPVPEDMDNVSISIHSSLEGVDDLTLISLEAIINDSDPATGSVYKYYWGSDESGLLGNEKFFNGTLKPGKHNITVNVIKDDYDVHHSKAIEVNVEDSGGYEDFPEDHEKDLAFKSFILSIAILLVFVIAPIICIIADRVQYFTTHRRKPFKDKKPPAESGEQSDGVDEKSVDAQKPGGAE